MKTVKASAEWTRATVAKHAGIGVETLRFYETKGLLNPPKRNAAGYRLYGEADLERLAFIRRAQDLGFSLQDIVQLLNLTGDLRTPRGKVRDCAEMRLKMIRQKIHDLRMMETSLSKLLSRCDGKGTLKGCPIAEFIGGTEITEQGGTHHE